MNTHENELSLIEDRDRLVKAKDWDKLTIRMRWTRQKVENGRIHLISPRQKNWSSLTKSNPTEFGRFSLDSSWRSILVVLD